MGFVEGLSMGVDEGLRSEMKNFEDPRGMRVYIRNFDIYREIYLLFD